MNEFASIRDSKLELIQVLSIATASAAQTFGLSAMNGMDGLEAFVGVWIGGAWGQF
jgi:hypothetical protein